MNNRNTTNISQSHISWVIVNYHCHQEVSTNQSLCFAHHSTNYPITEQFCNIDCKDVLWLDERWTEEEWLITFWGSWSFKVISMSKYSSSWNIRAPKYTIFKEEFEYFVQNFEILKFRFEIFWASALN